METPARRTHARPLATWLDGYLDEYPDTTTRTVDRSLGLCVILESLNAPDGDEVLENVSLSGAAVNLDTVCDDGTYEPGITNAADAVYNYHSENDDIVCNMYQFAEFDEGLGCNGSNCDTAGSSGPAPSNYADVDVSDQVDNHSDYGKPDVDCVPRSSTTSERRTTSGPLFTDHRGVLLMGTRGPVLSHRTARIL